MNKTEAKLFLRLLDEFDAYGHCHYCSSYNYYTGNHCNCDAGELIRECVKVKDKLLREVAEDAKPKCSCCMLEIKPDQKKRVLTKQHKALAVHESCYARYYRRKRTNK